MVNKTLCSDLEQIADRWQIYACLAGSKYFLGLHVAIASAIHELRIVKKIIARLISA